MVTNENKPKKRAPRKAQSMPMEAASTAPDQPTQLPDDAGDGGGVDPRDDEIARLEARLQVLREPPPPPDPKEARLAELRAAVAEAEVLASRSLQPDGEMDARDRTIAELRRQVEELRSTPEGAHAELLRAFATLQAQVTAMQNGTGKVPVPVSDVPDPYLYGMSLSCGCVGMAQHPHATHTFCAEKDGSPRHGNVQVKGYWRLADGEEPADTHAEVVSLRAQVKQLHEAHAAQVKQLREAMA